MHCANCNHDFETDHPDKGVCVATLTGVRDGVEITQQCPCPYPMTDEEVHGRLLSSIDETLREILRVNKEQLLLLRGIGGMIHKKLTDPIV